MLVTTQGCMWIQTEMWNFRLVPPKHKLREKVSDFRRHERWNNRRFYWHKPLRSRLHSRSWLHEWSNWRWLETWFRQLDRCKDSNWIKWKPNLQQRDSSWRDMSSSREKEVLAKPDKIHPMRFLFWDILWSIEINPARQRRSSRRQTIQVSSSWLHEILSECESFKSSSKASWECRAIQVRRMSGLLSCQS